MKTHDLAKQLEVLAVLLKSGPNVDVAELQLGPRLHQDLSSSSENIAVNLNTLAGLSRIDRHQWLALIRQYSLPIELRPRDASRDILGKLLRYLEEHPDARQRLRNTVAHKAAQASPELMRALSILLKD